MSMRFLFCFVLVALSLLLVNLSLRPVDPTDVNTVHTLHTVQNPSSRAVLFLSVIVSESRGNDIRR